MGVVLNTNMSALAAYNNLKKTQSRVDSTLEKLSSGLRIHRAADDAAGLAISEKLRTQVNGLNQAQRNIQDGVSVMQTGDGGLTETHALLQRMRTLAVQAANGTNSAENLRQIQAEMNQLTAEIDHVADGVQFNGMTLLNGSFHDKQLQIGANAGDTMQVDIYSQRMPATPLVPALPAVPAEPPLPAKTALWDVDRGLPAAGSTVSIQQTVAGVKKSVDVVMPTPGPTSVTELVAVLRQDAAFAADFTARTSSYSIEGPQFFNDVNLIVESRTLGYGQVSVSGLGSSWEQVDPGYAGRPEIPEIPEVPAKPERFLGYHASEILVGMVDLTKEGGSYTANLPYVANVKWLVDGKTYMVPAPTVAVPSPVLKVKAGTSSLVKAVPATPANYTFAAGATTEWPAAGVLKDDKGSIDLSSATAPTGTDAPGATLDKVTLTGFEGVQWRVDAIKVVKVAVGKTVTVIGRTVAAEPLVPSDYTITAGKSAWTATELGFTDGAVQLSVPEAAAPIGTNATGVTKDTVRLTGVANVKWQIGAKISSVAAGAQMTVPMRAGDTLVAVPALGYTLTGTTSWTGADLGLVDDPAAITVVAPTADDLGGASKDVVVLTPAANVVWELAGVKYTPTGTTPLRVSTKGKDSVIVKALPKMADFAIANHPATWTLTFSLDKATVTPTAPEVVADAHAIKLTKTSGVVWKVDSVNVAMANNVVYYVVPATKSSVTVTASLVDTVDYAFADGVMTSYPLSLS